MSKTLNNAISIRKMRGLSQTELADMIGVEQPTISRFEKGVGSTTLRLINLIASALDVEVYELFLGESRPKDEEMLVSVFRGLSDDRRQGWMDMVQAAKNHASSKDQ